MNQTLWIGAGVALTFAVVRVLKSDASATLLAQFGIPPIPKNALPWASLFVGILYSVLQLRANGSSWEEAGVQGFLEGLGIGMGTSATVDLAKGVPGVKKVVSVLLVLGFAAHLSACAWLQKHGPTIADILLRTTKCAVEHQDLPYDQRFVVCGMDQLQRAEVDQVEAAVAASREQVAAARRDERWKVATSPCGPLDADAGAW